ncbi:four helix bundle protein [Salinimicrobium tongyeongense]|uniref:Four helix bundle protein n=1 Tax=Salinimicrobium tongyeongense TaxID=2809707 RepID=A0ABY6NQE1_9FLAO|nr:four helix bundle protein [Salinimicrobium tongyeongense]UZH55028.1 four helix bundle protein [Salinimicrobium tongyeongense]
MKDLKLRTKEFAVDCWKFCHKIPHSREYNAYVNQLIRSSSSVGANYRAAQRAKSTADFINKLKIVEEEADESMYFLELFLEILDHDLEEVKALHSEANEIISIVVASINTAKRNQKER